MKKIFLFAILLLIGLLIGGSVAWLNRSSLAAYFLSRQLGVPVTIEALNIGKGQLSLTRSWVGNPPQSRMKTAFTAESIEAKAEPERLFIEPLTIDRIEMDQIYIGIEYYNPQETNWDLILKSKQTSTSSRKYLIKKLIVQEVSIEVMQANGAVKRYPTIDRMEFDNISSESGFPLDEVEKAIFKLMLQDALKRLNLQPLLQPLFQGPTKLIPGLF